MTGGGGQRGRRLAWLLGAWLGLAAPPHARADEPAPRTVQIPPRPREPVAKDPALAKSTAPTAAEIAQLGRGLGSADRATRRAAFETLSTLSDAALPAIASHLSQLSARELDRDAVLAALSEFRRVQSVELPDAEVDLAKGVLPALERDRGPATQVAAQLVALLRALEAQKSPQAGELIVGRLFALDSRFFRYEMPRTQARLSVLLIPALIRHQAHVKPWIRAFCTEALQGMGVASPGRAVQQDDVALLAAILTAYGDTLNFEAMPVVVSYVTDERLEVRRAARRAVERFGRNAIWQIRERYLNASGHDADPSWSYERTLKELYQLHDGPKRQAFTAALARAREALDGATPQAARRILDEALTADPTADDAKQAAPLYAHLAETALGADDTAGALDLFRRAVRLDPDAQEAPALRARIAYLEGEARLEQGVVDLTSYRRAAELDPNFGAAQDALDELSGARSARDLRLRRALGLAAAVLMAIAGFVLLRRTRPTSGEPPPDANPAEEPAAEQTEGTSASA